MSEKKYPDPIKGLSHLVDRDADYDPQDEIIPIFNAHRVSVLASDAARTAGKI